MTESNRELEVGGLWKGPLFVTYALEPGTLLILRTLSIFSGNVQPSFRQKGRKQGKARPSEAILARASAIPGSSNALVCGGQV